MKKKSDKFIIANKALNQSEELLQKNLQEISDYKYALDESTIIAITDQKGIINKVNSNFCKISKYSEEELIGQDHRIINSGYHTKEIIRDLWVTIANGKIWKGELKNKAKGGNFYWVDTTIVPFLNEEGKPYQYLAIRADITDRKEAEDNLIQRTAQLVIANKELAFQNEEKENRAAQLVIANKELAFQNDEKEKRAAELISANKLASQKEEIEKRSAELIIANKELKKANERFELIGKATNDGLWDWNLETSLVWGNEVHQQMYGLSLADPVPNYEEWKHRIHPEDRERTVKALEETMASECNIFITEYRFNTENIGWINIYSRTLIERNNEGKPVRLIGSMMDITKSKKVEQGIKESEEKYRTLVEQASDAIFITDTAGRFITVNASACKLSQYSEKELLKKTIYDLAVTEDLQKNPFHFDELKEGKTVINERVINRKNGILLNVEVTSKLLSDGRLLVFVRDITVRKNTEKEILRVIERYDMIAKATSDTIWDWDITNDKILYNEGVTNMFGYEKAKIQNIADWWKIKIHPDDMQIVQEAVAAAFKKQSYNLQLKYRFRCADESFKYIYDRAFIIYDEHKKPCKMIGAMQDITKLKENEISLIELNENLQKQTQELSISNEELEAQNQILQDIAWTQSHIVRAPLARILGIVTIIKDLRVESPDYEEWINHFITSANELDNIIKDIVNKTDTTKLDKF